MEGIGPCVVKHSGAHFKVLQLMFFDQLLEVKIVRKFKHRSALVSNVADQWRHFVRDSEPRSSFFFVAPCLPDSGLSYTVGTPITTVDYTAACHHPDDSAPCLRI